MESFSTLLFQLRLPDPADPNECATLYNSIRSRAYEELKASTGQDFGYDADAWEKWGRESGILKCELPKW